jgi:hypothetical protein
VRRLDGRGTRFVYLGAMKLRAYSTLLATVLILPAIFSCDKATPVAPDGAIISISASPTQIPLDGTAVITVIGRKPDGQPLNPGTEIRFNVGATSGSGGGGGGGTGGGGAGGSGGSGGSTTGSATATGPSIDPSIAEIRNGVATAVFRGGSSPGAVSVTASTGGTISVTTSIQVGATTGSKPTLIVSVNPSSIQVGEQAVITVIARNPDGTRVGAGERVSLTTTLGSVSPANPTTDSNGTATATLRSGNKAGTATISALLGTSDATTTTLSILDVAQDIIVSANPSSITPTPEGTDVSLVAQVVNAQSQPVSSVSVIFSATRGSFTKTSNIVLTDTNGVARATLTVKTSDVGPTDAAITVTISTAGPGGNSISKNLTIELN